MSRNLPHGLQGLIIILIVLCMAGCSRVVVGRLPIGVLSSNPPDQVAQDVFPIAIEQQAGYKLGLLSGYKLVQASEGNLQDDIQVSIRAMVEDEKVVAVIGATTNEATMRATSLVNFFNVPMIVPSANGDNLLPSNNLWVFRLSAPSSAYGKYLFGTVLLQPAAVVGQGTTESPQQVQGPKLAIIYEQNTFGESAAVATARAAMSITMDITLYESFQPVGMDSERLMVLAQDVKSSGANLVYLVSNDPQVAKALVTVLHNQYDVDKEPILVGMEGGFASLTFLEAKEAQGVYVIRQALEMKDCPIEKESIFEAQSYAATYLVEEAIKQVESSVPATNLISSITKPKADLLIVRREMIRDALKQMDIKVPCIGQVKFDNTGQNKNQQFGLLLIEAGKTTVVSEEEFRKTLENIVARDALNNNE